ncbi:hypothetical protein [Streptomyces sp. JB150]|uniref:hypothetical protein n=1 Tax=Streptomyces sp. JB150 TaxID=2714844 RepID=UPI00140E3FAC|nr:hypothetical protein [Streptomyces sp. JB150]QIJ62566.1 hypothetical protein G7Z13_11350 [Streptomyces sp. JB150]
MSDEFERETQLLGNMLLAVYTLLHRVCGLLPIPIQLPDFDGNTLRGTEMNEAVTRLVEVINDEPVDELVQSGIWGAGLHWLSASHLFSRYMDTREGIVALEIRLNIVTAHDGLHAVEDLLLGEDPDD